MEAVSDIHDTIDPWVEIGPLTDIPRLGARVVQAGEQRIALFRTADDRVFALRDQCPHKAGPLSQGIVHDTKVTCPLHDWKIHLDTGQAVAPDEGCTATYPVMVEKGIVHLRLKPGDGCPNE
jgi:nitrite reductase (NADH) small subunit